MYIQYKYLIKYFRVQASHEEDLGKTRVRMNKSDMLELGLQEGNIVKITGGKTTYAFCLQENDNKDQNGVRFVCLDDSSKKMGVIKVSDQTYSNLRNYHFGNLVTLEKSSAVKADKITIRSIHVMSDVKNQDYDLGWLEDHVVVSRGDRIVGRSSDPKKIPGFFVIDGLPDSHAWIVDKETQVEISYDKIPEDVNSMITEPGDLKAVIPVVQKISGEDFEATISSIEVYDNCMKIQMYVKDILVHQEDWTSGLCTPTISGWDDLGNKYVLNRYSGRGGGSQLGDSLWGVTNRSNFSEISCILTPTLDDHAQELTLSVEQLLWDVRKHPMPQRVTPVTKGQPNVMMPARLDEKFVIHGGPWELKIKLGEK